jgi:hypothetical protein
MPDPLLRYQNKLSCQDHKGFSVQTVVLNKVHNIHCVPSQAITNKPNNVPGTNLVPPIFFTCFSMLVIQKPENSIQKLVVAREIESRLLL